MELWEKKLSGKTVYNGRIMRIDVDEVELPGGLKSSREVMHHCPGVGVLPVFEDGSVMLVRQYRYPMDEILLEIPAGKLDPGEQPLDGAMRELKEETGLTAQEYVYLGKAYPSPGCMNEVLHIYLARGLTQGESSPDEGEFLQCERMPLKKLTELVETGGAPDAKTVIAALYAERYFSKEAGK